MIWFILGIVFLILGLFYQKKKGDFGNRVVVNAEITQILEKEHCVYVKYTYPDNCEATVAMCSDVDADFSKLRIGTKIFVVIDKDNPSCPIIARYNTKGKNLTIEGSTKAAFIMAILFFIVGIIKLF